VPAFAGPSRPHDRANEPQRLIALLGILPHQLAQARALSRHVPRQAVPALLPATLAEAYLRRMERRGFNLFDPRLGLSKPGRQARLLVKAIRGRF